MTGDFEQVSWDSSSDNPCRRLAELAREEDLAGGIDHTAAATVPADARGAAAVVAREAGVVAGLLSIRVVAEVFGAEVRVSFAAKDGQQTHPGNVLARLDGSVRDILVVERTLLNFVGRLSGVASLTRKYVDAIAGTTTRLYDTRKTTPGWRRLEKYAVRCGGGYNHRQGLHAAILVKDNHIAARAAQQSASEPQPLAAMVRSLRGYASDAAAKAGEPPLWIEVEVDSLDQLRDVLAGEPDIVLLDNMDVPTLRQAVDIRDSVSPTVELEASGGVSLQTIAAIAETGIERISVGALTHHAVWLDIGLDWLTT